MPRKQPDTRNDRQKWADYCRIRLRPNKICVKCQNTLPNDRAHFSINSTGRLTSTCHHCAEAEKRHAALVAKAGPERNFCPICETFDDLVLDHQAPRPVRLCRPCLHAVNSLRRSGRVTPAQFLERMLAYATWQQSELVVPAGRK